MVLASLQNIMVVFSCDGCADVLKKSQVDSHARRCRQCQSVSCADCLVSFYGGMCFRYSIFGRFAWTRGRIPMIKNKSARLAVPAVGDTKCFN